MRRFFTLLIPIFCITFCACVNKSTNHKNALPHAKNVTVDTTTFHNIFKEMNAASNELHSLMVIQDDSIIYERYQTGFAADQLHVMWSGTKTFNCLAVGFAEQDGLLNINDPVINYFEPEELPEDITGISKVTIDNVLSMTSGLKSWDVDERLRMETQTENPIKDILSSPFAWEPGTHFNYNNMDSYLAAVIVQRVTGKSMDEYLTEKLFSHIGIGRHEFVEDMFGYNPGGWGLYLTTEDYAKAALFILHKGMWNGERLLNEEWFDKAMAVHIHRDVPNFESDWGCGYCYQMWKCKKDDAVRADGAWGQYAIIMPAKNAVAVMTSFVTDREYQLNSFWKNVYEYLPYAK